MQTLLITVTGKVQGVFYRQSTKEKATTLGICGTVSNKPDGSVEIIITTTEEKAAQLIEWCKQGPPKAIVKNIDTREIAYSNFSDFRILR